MTHKADDVVSALVHAVTMAFIETGKDLTVSEMAKVAKMSVDEVNRILTGCYGYPEGLYRESTGSHWVYGPSRATLKSMAPL